MGVLLPELAPVALRALLVPLMRFAAFGVALGILFMLHHFVRATVGGIAGIIGHVPIVNRFLSTPVNAVYHWMDHEFGVVENFLDAQMASALHQLARLVEQIGHQLREHSELLLALASLASNPFSLKAWRVYFAHLLAIARHASVQIRHATTGYIGAAIHAATRPIVGELHALERWTYPRVKALDQEITVTIPRDVAGLRARTKTIEGELARAWEAIRKLDKVIATTAFVGAVALALERLGGSWIRCRNWNRIGREVCNTPLGDIESLLALLATGAVLADFRELVKLAQSVEHGVAATLQDVAKL